MSDTMKAAVVPELGQPLDVREVPVPAPGPFEALVKVDCTRKDMTEAAGLVRARQDHPDLRHPADGRHQRDLRRHGGRQDRWPNCDANGALTGLRRPGRTPVSWSRFKLFVTVTNSCRSILGHLSGRARPLQHLNPPVPRLSVANTNGRQYSHG